VARSKEPHGYTRTMAERSRAIGRLTSRMLAQSRVIAKGNRIRDVQRLVTTYGGKRSTWVKKSSPPFEMGRHSYEYHWYEHPGIGRVELKRKRVH
jgi:hypothetical protein